MAFPCEITARTYKCDFEGIDLITTVTSDSDTVCKWILRVMKDEEEKLLVGVKVWEKSNRIDAVLFSVNDRVLIYHISSALWIPRIFALFFNDPKFIFVGINIKAVLLRLGFMYGMGIEMIDHVNPKVEYEDLVELAEEILQRKLERPEQIKTEISAAELGEFVFGESFTCFLLDVFTDMNDRILFGAIETFLVQQIAYNLGAGLYERTRSGRMPSQVTRRLKMPLEDEMKISEECAQQDVDKAHDQRISWCSYIDNSLWGSLNSKVSEEDQTQVLRQAYQERDRAWQFEIDSLLKQDSLDSDDDMEHITYGYVGEDGEEDYEYDYDEEEDDEEEG